MRPNNIHADGLATTGATRTGSSRQAAMPEHDPAPGSKRGKQAGFTLVELLIVMAIMVLLASLVAPRVIGYLGASRTKAARIQMESLGTTLELYRIDTGRYPSNDQGLAALVIRPQRTSAWNGPYLHGTALPNDPWGRPYYYRYPGQNNVFDIYSLGADGQTGGNDENEDVTNWTTN